MRHYFIAWLCLFNSTLGYAASNSNDVSMEPIKWFDGTGWDNVLLTFERIDTLTPIDDFSLTGGHHISILTFLVLEPATYVVDFRNSAFIEHFSHQLFSSDDRLVFEQAGGVSVEGAHDYFLRNGANVVLSPGRYYLVTRQNSQFNIAPPTPFVMERSAYLVDIRLGNAISLVGFGVFVSLFFYFFSLSIARTNFVDFAYALFILGNLLFNGTTLLVFNHLFGVTWFGGGSWPILFSNIAYVVFVMSLLNVNRTNFYRLWLSGIALLMLLVTSVVLSLFYPHIQNELNRIGVGLFICFGLVCGINMGIRGSIVARWYVLANIGFFVLAMVAITQEQISGLQTIYMSHIGLLAVACEVLLLSFVVSYQMSRVEIEKSQALTQAEETLVIARTDQLTQLPNRYSLNEKLQTMAPKHSFIYLDLDGLKHCNDTYGHKVGDQLLLNFSRGLSEKITKDVYLYRIGGDEFAMIYPTPKGAEIALKIAQVEQELKQKLNAFVGVSYGVADFTPNEDYNYTIQRADQAMYENKKQKRTQSA